MATPAQSDLFHADGAWPAGLCHEPEFLSRDEEARLLQQLAELPFAQARYHEWTARRRVVAWGSRFDFTHNLLRDADPVPAFLLPLRERVAAWAGVEAADFRHVLASEYAAGTPLGWHRDAPCYELVAGISLGSSARMRLRPWPPDRRDPRAARVLDLEPRSIYRLTGPARWQWQHAISPTKALRYSITFRTLAAGAGIRT